MSARRTSPRGCIVLAGKTSSTINNVVPEAECRERKLAEEAAKKMLHASSFPWSFLSSNWMRKWGLVQRNPLTVPCSLKVFD
jgi:hypothetical protein